MKTVDRKLLLEKPPEGYEPTNCIVMAIDRVKGANRLLQMWLRPEDMKHPEGKEQWVYVPVVVVV